jgi:hypothetical protein
VQRALARLTSAGRQDLPCAIADCLTNIDALRDVLTVEQPDTAAYVTARRQLTESIVALTDLLGQAAVPDALRAMTRLRLNREVELSPTSVFGVTGYEEWVKLVGDTARQARSALEAIRGAAPAEAVQPDAPDEPEQYLTLDQAAALVNRHKKTLERHINRSGSAAPPPDVEGGGGRPHEWRWTRLRPWLEQTFGRRLPTRLPTLARRS